MGLLGSRVAVAGWAGVALVVGWTVAPLLVPGTGLSARDAAFSAVQMTWLADWVLGRVPLWDAPLGAPLGQGTARADWVLAQALLSVPGRLAGLAPERLWALATVFGIVSSALAAGCLAQRLFGPGAPVVVAAAGAACGPAVIGHAQHANLVQHAPWLCAVLLAWRGRAFAAGLLAALSFHAGVYTGLHAVVALGCVLVGRGQPRHDARALVGGALGGSTVLPVLLHYRSVATREGWTVEASQNLAETLDLARLLSPLGGAPLHSAIWGPRAPSPDPALPGYGLAILGLIGVVRLARRRDTHGLVLLGVVAFALALGPVLLWDGRPTGLPLPGALLDLAWSGGLRGPARWVAVAHGVLALGAAALAASLPGRWPWALAALVAGLLWAETPRVPAVPIPAWPESLVQAVAEAPGQALLDRPGRDRCGEGRFAAALASGKALVGGNYARYSPVLAEVNHRAARWPDDEVVQWLHALGAVVVEHPPFRGAVPSGVSCAAVDGHRVCVRDPGVGG